MGLNLAYKNISNSLDMFNTLFGIFTGTVPSTGGSKWLNTVASAADGTNYFYVFEPTQLVDSYLATDSTQIYYMIFKGSYGTDTNNNQVIETMDLFIGTDKQITFDANNPTTTIPVLDASLTPLRIFDYSQRINPMVGNDLTVTMTSRGFAFIISSIDTVNARYRNSFVCIQRPVDPSTGNINVSGTCPIFALAQECTDMDYYDLDYPYGPFSKDGDVNAILTADGQIATPYDYTGHVGLHFLVIRETDIDTTSLDLDTYNVVAPSGSSNNNYTPGIMYSLSQDWTYPVTFDDSSYVMRYPFGFMTSRNTYIDEMDLISFVNASVFPYNYDIDINVYSETSNRVYETSFGLNLSGAYTFNRWVTGTMVKARIAILKSGGGI